MGKLKNVFHNFEKSSSKKLEELMAIHQVFKFDLIGLNYWKNHPVLGEKNLTIVLLKVENYFSELLNDIQSESSVANPDP